MLGIPVILIAERDTINDYLEYLPPNTLIVLREEFENTIHQAITIYHGDLLAALESSTPSNEFFFGFYLETNHTRWDSVTQLIKERSRRVTRVPKAKIENQ